MQICAFLIKQSDYLPDKNEFIDVASKLSKSLLKFSSFFFFGSV